MNMKIEILAFSSIRPAFGNFVLTGSAGKNTIVAFRRAQQKQISRDCF